MVQLQTRAVDRVHGRSRKRNGNAGRDLEQVAAKQCGVVRTAASDENDEFDVTSFEQCAESCDLATLVRNRAFERRGLLRDLCEH
jgi:hypothetical protein